MIEIKEAVIVEGKYDKMRLKGILNSVIVETGGFRLFKDAEKRTEAESDIQSSIFFF